MTKTRTYKTPKHVWSPCEVDLLRDLYPDVPTGDIAALLDLGVGSVYQKAATLGIKKTTSFLTGVSAGRIQRGQQHPAMQAARFKPGQTPWNKGMEYHPSGRCAETQFKKGNRPQTWQPLGSLRITADGYLERKVTNLPGPNHVRWHGVHRLVWAAAHGPIPPRHMVVFKPGQKTTVLEQITADKLDCITRGENARRNHPHSKDPEMGRLSQLKGAITRQVNRIAREQRAQQESQST